MPLPTAFPSTAEDFWDDSAKEDIAGTDEARNTLRKIQKKGLCFLLCR